MMLPVKEMPQNHPAYLAGVYYSEGKNIMRILHRSLSVGLRRPGSSFNPVAV